MEYSYLILKQYIILVNKFTSSLVIVFVVYTLLYKPFLKCTGLTENYKSWIKGCLNQWGI